MSLKLSEGTYTVVAVGHSSKNSATIKSPESVQFTASEGEKLTDTFCACQVISVSGENANHTLPMYRVGAMIQFVLTDKQVPNILRQLEKIFLCVHSSYSFNSWS